MTDKTFKDYLKEDNITEAVDQPLIDAVVDQIIRDLDMGDQTAIEELLMSCPEANLRGFLSEVNEGEYGTLYKKGVSRNLAVLKKNAGIT
tara:strand:- start:858 stop:1127 length:270 start_codon:yes stop_codon:yes gene_type:complete